MTTTTGPGQAAQNAARRRGITLPPEAANEIAAAVLDHSDGLDFASQRIDRHQWSNPDTRENLRRKLRRDLALQLADGGVVAAGPFTENLTYLKGWMPGGDRQEVPAHLAENGDAPWDYVEVKVSVPIRTFE
ncbi:hypothetical protein [Actinomadura miaoliensis]|uniref:Uncharacterized protein n=1 Tax=Actinomadura miaoliensis TaxID=430685 RepID=A0ABP7W7C2_9ACTN